MLCHRCMRGPGTICQEEARSAPGAEARPAGGVAAACVHGHALRSLPCLPPVPDPINISLSISTMRSLIGIPSDISEEGR